MSAGTPLNHPVWIVIPVYNRKAITLACLATLKQQGDLAQYAIVVVDDGSTDGTREAIRSAYPEVMVLAGNGNLWWAGAIRMGMEYAIQQGAEFCIWLNDDCYPQPGTIATLLQTCRQNPRTIAGGQSLDPDTQQPSYGGIICEGTRITHVHTAPGSVLECDGLAGNLVCIPRAVVAAIGFPDARECPHYYADVVYTHRAQRQGYQLLIVGDAIAHCRNDHPPISWMMSERSPLEIWRERFLIKSPHYWKAHLAYYQEMMGWVGIWFYIYQLVIKFSVISILIVLLPKSLRMRLKQLVTNKSVES